MAPASLSPSAGSVRWSERPAPPGPSPAGSKMSNQQVGQLPARVSEPGQKSAPSECRMNAVSEGRPQRAESEPLCAMSSPSAGCGAKALAAEASRQQARLSPKVDSGRGRPARPAESRSRQGSSCCRASSAPHHARTPGALARGGSHAAPPAPHPPRARPPWRAHAHQAAACRTPGGSVTPCAERSVGQERYDAVYQSAMASRVCWAAASRSAAAPCWAAWERRTRERAAPGPAARPSPELACAGQRLEAAREGCFHAVGQRVSAWPEALTAPHAEPSAG